MLQLMLFIEKIKNVSHYRYIVGPKLDYESFVRFAFTLYTQFLPHILDFLTRL